MPQDLDRDLLLAAARDFQVGQAEAADLRLKAALIDTRDLAPTDPAMNEAWAEITYLRIQAEAWHAATSHAADLSAGRHLLALLTAASIRCRLSGLRLIVVHLPPLSILDLTAVAGVDKGEVLVDGQRIPICTNPHLDPDALVYIVKDPGGSADRCEKVWHAPGLTDQQLAAYDSLRRFGLEAAAARFAAVDVLAS